MITFRQKLCAWLYMHTIPGWIGEYVTRTVSDHSWEVGFRAAVIELQCKCSVMLDALPRMSACRTSNFDPVRPVLLNYDPMFFDDWDAGYERAILLWRLGLEPGYLLMIRHVLTQRTGIPCFDGLIHCVIDGDLRSEPRIWRNRKGQHLLARHGYQKALDMVYCDYTEKYQQVRAAQLRLVEIECAYCAKTVDECICKEPTK